MTRPIALATLLILSSCGEVPFRREIQVRVVDPEGRRLDALRGGVLFVFTDPKTGAVRSASHGGLGEWAHLVQDRADAVLRVLSPGCAPFVAAALEDRMDIQLAYGVPALIRVQLEGRLPAPPLSLELEVTSLDEHESVRAQQDMVAAGEAWFRSPHARRARRIVVPSSRELRLWFPATGRYELNWILYERNDVRTPGHISLGGFGHGPGERGARQVAIDGPDQVIEFPIDAEELKRGIATFK